jgi:succinate dehydrogenase/fumarate reductase-like Fe-S protein
MVEMLPRFVVTVEPVRDETVIKELTVRVDAVMEEVPKDDRSAVDTVRDDNRSVLA